MIDSMALRVAARYKQKKKTEKGNTVYLYSERQIAHRNKKKAERLAKLNKSIKSLRAKVKKDLGSSDPKVARTALAVGLIDHTYERVGNDESAKDGHFGVTGWKKKHVSQDGGSINYVGKSGVKQQKKITDASLRKALKSAYGDCKGDCIFTYEGGKVGATDVNSYLNEFDITAKDIRGLHANREMQDKLKKARKGALPTDKKEREKQLKSEFLKALDETAKAVGHEASTLRSQYLVPGLEESYLKDGTVTGKFGSGSGEEGLGEYLQGFFRRHSGLKRYAPSRIIEKSGGSGSHPEARQHGNEVWVFPKFWRLDSKTQDFVMAHEIGHYALSRKGTAYLLREAEKLGLDLWDQLSLPFGQGNMEEAFADSFASYFLGGSELKRRYPEWVILVEAITK